MAISLTRDTLTEALSVCAANLKLHLITEVERLVEELETDLVSRFGIDGDSDVVELKAASDDTRVDNSATEFPHLEIDVAADNGQPGLTNTRGTPRRDMASSAAGVVGDASEASTATPVPNPLSLLERELERQKSAENASKFGIPALPLNSLSGNRDGNTRPTVAKVDLGGEAEKSVANPEKPTTVEMDNPVEEERQKSDKSELTELSDIQKEALVADEAQSSRLHARSSRLWMRSVSSVSMDKSEGKCCIIRLATQLVGNKYFEGFFNIIIVLNCVTMGLEAEQTVKGPSSDASYYSLLITEHSFTLFFCIELGVRYSVFGWRSFIPTSSDNWWNFMDAFLVIITGVLFTWVVPSIQWILDAQGDTGAMRVLATLRAARLLRLVRVVQRVPQFREAWLLLRGLTDSMRTLFWTCAVIMFVTYLFAVFGVVLITKEITVMRDETSDESLKKDLTELLEFVGGLDLLMYTLIQLLTMDSWNGIVRRLKEHISWCWLYFYAYIAVACFVLMNLVTAIIVENAVTNSRQDEDQVIKSKEKAKLEELRSLEALFVLMDADGSGTLSWDEFKAAFDDPEMTKKWKLLDFDPDECKELFGLLDDGDGEIETHEFFEGLAQMKGVAQSKDVFRLRKIVEGMVENLTAKDSDGGGSKHGTSSLKGTPRKQTTPRKGSTPRKETSTEKQVEALAAKSDVKEEILEKLPATCCNLLREEKKRKDLKDVGTQTKIAKTSKPPEAEAATRMAFMPPAPLEMEMALVPSSPTAVNPGKKLKI